MNSPKECLKACSGNDFVFHNFVISEFIRIRNSCSNVSLNVSFEQNCKKQINYVVFVKNSPCVKESRIQQNLSFGIRNPRVWNPESKLLLDLENGIRNPRTGIRKSTFWDPASTSWDPESDNAVDSFTYRVTSIR